MSRPDGIKRLLRPLGTIVPAALLLLLPAIAAATPAEFSLPAQSAAKSLLAFSRQADVEVLFPYDKLDRVEARALSGRHEPDAALEILLQGTGFAARANGPRKFVVGPELEKTGSVRGTVLTIDGNPVRGARVTAAGTDLSATTDRRGNFKLAGVESGPHRLTIEFAGHQSAVIDAIRVEAGRTSSVPPTILNVDDTPGRLDPYFVYGKSDPASDRRKYATRLRTATGNLDLVRTEDDALPFRVFTREQISRSGVVNLNEFLQRELLDSDAAASPAEQSATEALFVSTGNNLTLRGFETDETVIFVNGRRLPETLRAETGVLGPADVNFVPLGLIEQIEVLPVSASAIYTGNAVGGVINIVLRPDIEFTELSATYTNRIGGYDAPQSTFTLQHGRSLLDNRLRFRLSASVFDQLPATDSELGYLRARSANAAGDESLHRATPNIRSAGGESLFGPVGSRFTSVAPGADGNGGLAAFAGRGGIRSTELFDTPGGMASSPVSGDFAYGRKHHRETLFGSVLYDPFRWLQVGVDVSHSTAQINRGFGVVSQDLELPAGSPLNPFGQDVVVSLNESPVALGADYNEARLSMTSLVAGALLKLPADWRVALDAQYSHNTARYRGLTGIDAGNWDALVASGAYNPLRDTRTHAAPAAFYDRVLIYHGGRGRFITLSEYETFDAAIRVTSQSLALPTGRGAANFGGDFRRNELAPFTDLRRYGDGGIVGNPVSWTGRTLDRYSVFGELQAPLIPSERLPRGVTGIDADIAVRYIASDRAGEANFAPTIALKASFAGGLSLRGSITTTNRFPTPHMSRPVFIPGGPGGGGEGVFVFDPVLNSSYVVAASEPAEPGLRSESAATQTLGLVYQRGEKHRLRVALDFFDTRKTDELFGLDAQGVVNVESLFPDRVARGAGGRIQSVSTGSVNAARRHSQNWNLSVTGTSRESFGGTLEWYARWVRFQRYERQLLANSPVVDQLGSPDGTMPGLLRDRANLGANWSDHRGGFGVDAHYFGPRILPRAEWGVQGSDRIDSTWQFDAYVHGKLSNIFPWLWRYADLRAQLRVNNVFDADFPAYENHGSGSGVQPYGDWRRRTYSLSVTAAF